MPRKIKTLPQNIQITRTETDPENMELVAKSIIDIADAVKVMRSKAKDKLIVLILHDMTGVNKRDIQRILDAAPKIANAYLNS